jgi:hypothetical protein
MGLSIPFLPTRIRASALLHGSNADFVTNAYLALQRQWPDDGGFAHYVHALGELGAKRADILREIANSSNAKQCGVSFIDDLPPEYEFRPEDHDSNRLLETSLTLRLARTAADVEQLRLAVSRLTAGELSSAVEGLVQAQLMHQAVLESRLNALVGGQPGESSVQAEGPEVEAVATVVPGPEGARQHLVVVQPPAAPSRAHDSPSTVRALQAEVAELRAEVQRLHSYATVELKREVADYVNALSSATQKSQHAASQASSTRDVARGRTHIHAVGRQSRSGA